MNQSTHNDDCRIKNARFVKGIRGEDLILQESVPQIVFAGRSNVGKSSTLNKLLGQKIARISSTPGKTQEINFFSIEGGTAYVVDLPGYGYAKMNGKQAESMRKQMIWYLGSSKAPIALLCLVIDIRRGLGGLDRDLLDIASGEAIPVLIVANKVDKCNQKERTAAERKLEADLESHPGIIQGVIAFSAETGRGRNTLCEVIQSIYAV
ncbi:MAG: ribosome biogenesis GTP-binding protein YihA/YsxC [Candidatus Paceibacterota bacterium]